MKQFEGSYPLDLRYVISGWFTLRRSLCRRNDDGVV